jgi:hypothetical protein
VEADRDKYRAILGEIFKWQVEREGEVHLILMGKAEWDEPNCPMCAIDEIMQRVDQPYQCAGCGEIRTAALALQVRLDDHFGGAIGQGYDWIEQERLRNILSRRPAQEGE